MQKQIKTVLVFLLAYISFMSCFQVVFERIDILYVNPKYAEDVFCNVTRAPTRGPYRYVLNCQFETKVCFDNNITLHFIFYERLTYTYQRSIFSMHFKACDVLKDPFMGVLFAKQGARCPFLANKYKWSNLTTGFENFPSKSPYEEGYAKLQFNLTETNEPVVDSNLYLKIINKPEKQKFKVKSKRV